MTDESTILFSKDDRLRLHQLRLLEWMDTEQQKKEAAPADASKEQAGSVYTAVPEQWQLTKGVSLYDWQKDCIDKWLQAVHRGPVKVVTGAGKTILGLAIAERLQNTIDNELRVAIVVPTVVLMHQWHDELLERGNLPSSAIGRLGGGYREGLEGGATDLDSRPGIGPQTAGAIGKEQPDWRAPLAHCR
jgi:superfamily II DNA or RNA helicase